MRIRLAHARDEARTLLRPRRLVMGYDAFVSYSHAADGQLAPALQLGLQRLARPWYRPRASAIFRDETGLAVSPHLWASIVRALDDSEWFVVLCSPEAAESEWIEREINHWLAHRRMDRILLVLTDGELVWDGNRGDFDPARSTALPPALVGRFGDEPRHLDLRWARDEEQLDVSHVRFRAAVAELAAPIRNMARDELEAEDVRQHRRTMLLARGATSLLVLLLVLALVLGGLAWQQRGTARHEAAIARRAANERLGEELAAQALNAAHGNHTDLAMLLAVEGYRVEPGVSERSSLLSVLVDQPTLERQLHGLTDTTSALAFSPNGRMLAAATVTGQLRIWDTRSGRPLAHQPNFSASPQLDADPFSPAEIAFADKGRLFAVTTGGTGTKARPRGVSVVDVATGRVRFSLPDVTGAGGGWSVSADAPVFAAADTSGTIQVWDIRSDRRIASIVTGGTQGTVALSPDAKSVAIARDWASGDAQVWNVASGRPIGPGCANSSASTSAGGSTGAGAVPLAPGLNVVLLADGVTVRTWDETGEGTTGTINTCHADTGRLDTQLLGPEAGGIQISEFAGVSRDGTTVASRSSDGTIQLLDVKSSGQPIGNPVRAPLVIHLDPLVTATVVFSPDGQHMTALEQNGDVRLWRITSALWRRSPDLPLDQRKAGGPNQPNVFEDPAGRIAVTRSGAVVDMRTGQSLARIRASYSSSAIRSFALDWPLLAVVVPNRLDVLDVQHHTTRTLRTDRIACSDGIGNIAISARSRVVLIACNNMIEAIDISSWPWRPAARPVPTSAASKMMLLSPDGRALAVFGNTTLQLFAVNGMHLRARRTYQAGASAFAFLDGAIAFTPDSHTLVFARSGGLIQLIGLNRQRVQSTTLAQPDGQIPGNVTVSPDGSLLAVTEGVGIRIWDLAAKQLLGTIPDRPAIDTISITSQAVTIRGFNSNSEDSSLSSFHFDLREATWQRLACTIANRNLTTAEWAQYLPGEAHHRTCPDTP